MILGYRQGRLPTYLHRKLLLKLFHFLFDSWWLPMIPSLKHVFPPATFAAELRRFRHRSQGKQPLFKHLHFLGLFAMLFHRLPSHREIELTEYKCQSVCVCLCVCVCPPLDKGLLSTDSTTTRFTTDPQAGGPGLSHPTWPNEAGCDRGSTKGRFGVYLPRLVQKLSNPLCLIHGGCMFTPINLFHAAELVTASPVQIDFATTWKQFSTIQLRRLFHLAVLRLSSHRGN